MGSFTTRCDICKAENAVPSYGDWQCVECGQKYEYDECYRISLTAAQWALLRSPPRWIPVSERLPDNDSVVLVWSLSNGLHLAYLDSLRQWRDGDDNPGKKITHWMPLPEPPEVK